MENEKCPSQNLETGLKNRGKSNKTGNLRAEFVVEHKRVRVDKSVETCLDYVA